MSSAERIDRAWLREHGGQVFEMHLRLSGSSQLAYKVVDRRDGRAIGLRFSKVSYTNAKSNRAKAGTSERVWWVDGHRDEISTLDEALEILAIQRTADLHIAEALVDA